eukprot:CAMPEP_0194519678 /NCGR_PEP_ID=MMETSP0253-20130528/53384_1 /TAXON_ID=2966 /ORGANISM="Noctiluca scintillans" /LENGTH=189 /DNA_ID=CAMNT_0039363837 /DNA_START=20 /DNA_END=589 /DNA_ORIENTATION=-
MSVFLPVEISRRDISDVQVLPTLSFPGRAGVFSPGSSPHSPFDLRKCSFGMSPKADEQLLGHVWFNMRCNEENSVTPYSQVYDVHPRWFDFDEEGRKVLSKYGQLLLKEGANRECATPSPSDVALDDSTDQWIVIEGLACEKPRHSMHDPSRSPLHMTLGMRLQAATIADLLDRGELHAPVPDRVLDQE